MLQVNLWLTEKFGNPLLYRCFWIAAAVALTVSVVYAFAVRPGILKVFLVIVIFALAYLMGSRQEYFEEKTHILMYGILGYLTARDLTGYGRRINIVDIAISVGFVALISACDEIFQLVLPYRFGEIGDFATNLLSGMLGTALYLALNFRRFNEGRF